MSFLIGGIGVLRKAIFITRYGLPPQVGMTTCYAASSCRQFFRKKAVIFFLDHCVTLAGALFKPRPCPGQMNSHTRMGGNQLDSKRDEINPKSL